MATKQLIIKKYSELSNDHKGHLQFQIIWTLPIKTPYDLVSKALEKENPTCVILGSVIRIENLQDWYDVCTHIFFDK